MLDKFLSKKINEFLKLIRFYNPIGFLLLMWPCWFSLTLVQINIIDKCKWFFLFFIGSFLMRSAGCIINDLIDINIDKKIKRTEDRPLTSKKISITEAIIFLLILLFLSLLILLQFNYKSILIGLLSFPLIIIYPFMKRFIYWPQLILGIVFNWGIIIVFFQFQNIEFFNFILLYIGCIFWTLAYDTIYAYQDRFDDINNNIKSSAVFLGDKGKNYVKFFYLIFFLITGYLSFIDNNNFYSLIVTIIMIIVINNALNKWDLKSRINSNYYFKINNIIGLVCFLNLFFF